ncbi:MAG: CDP-diacylglycerol--glycerol-3-phosphate 3-phosphatidyltransferase [Burkholderiales bacterium]
MPVNVPNLLTWLRIIAIPLLVALFYLPDAWLPAHDRNLYACVLFAAAAVTDWLDGYLARRLNQTSAFGAFLDPVADKLIVAAALILLVELARVSGYIAVIIIGREITISALREWMAKVGQAKSVAVNLLGKIKTVAQLVAIPMLLYHDPVGAWFSPARVGTWLIYLAAALTIVSMAYYLKLAAPQAFGRGGRA